MLQIKMLKFLFFFTLTFPSSPDLPSLQPYQILQDILEDSEQEDTTNEAEMVGLGEEDIEEEERQCETGDKEGKTEEKEEESEIPDEVSMVVFEQVN